MGSRSTSLGGGRSTAIKVLIGVTVLAVVAFSVYSFLSPPNPNTTPTTTPPPTTTSPPPTTTPPPTGTIQYTIPKSVNNQVVTTTFAGILQSGSVVTGSVQLTGAPQSRDNSFAWQFQVLDPAGTVILDWTGDWMKNTLHSFSFTATSTGTYKLVVTHQSIYQKYLEIKVQPSSWLPSTPVS